METLSLRHSFELGYKLGLTVRGPQDDLSIRELQTYAPHADIEALRQGFEDGKLRDPYRFNLGRRLWDEKQGVRRPTR